MKSVIIGLALLALVIIGGCCLYLQPAPPPLCDYKYRITVTGVGGFFDSNVDYADSYFWLGDNQIEYVNSRGLVVHYYLPDKHLVMIEQGLWMWPCPL